MKTLQLMALGLLAAGLLAGCSGDDDDVAVTPAPPAAVTEVPASAGATAAAFTAFGVAQVAATSETDDPLGTDQVSVAPTSETDDPVSL